MNPCSDYEWESDDLACPHCGVSSEEYDNIKSEAVVEDGYSGEYRTIIVLRTCICDGKYYCDLSP